MTSVDNKNTTKNQFRHTQLWNSIIVYMKANIQIKRHRRGIKYFNNSFNGTEFVEILYDYLMTNQKQFDRQVTKDKVIKLSQSLMDYGVFEPVNALQSKFENTQVSLYRFKEDPSSAVDTTSMKTSDCGSENKENLASAMIKSISLKLHGGTTSSATTMAPKANQSDYLSRRMRNATHGALSLRKMLDNLREKPEDMQNDRHNFSQQRVTREIILEKLLTLIDLPIFEQFLDTKEVDTDNDPDDPSFVILNQIFDITRSDINEEWRSSAIECVRNVNKEKKPGKINIYELPDGDLYTIINDYYTKHKFFSAMFFPLFANILILLKHGFYNKAKDILNLTTLLLQQRQQAELKRLLKFLYLTSNNTSAPRLCATKPNNIIVLNNFAECLFKRNFFTFEETRLMLNFMFNNFDCLFTITKHLDENIKKRQQLLTKYGDNEEYFLDKQYCKKISAVEYANSVKENTTKCLVELANHLIDDSKISLKEKEKKLRLLASMHPDIYEQHFSNMF